MDRPPVYRPKISPNVNKNVDYGPCDFDLRNNWTSNVVFQLPFAGNRFKEGWKLTAIASVHSGTPYSVYDAIDQANVREAGAVANAERPDLVGTNNNPNGIRRTSSGIFGFDPSAFALQHAGIFGDLSRNTLTAPGVRTVDLGFPRTLGSAKAPILTCGWIFSTSPITQISVFQTRRCIPV